MDSWLKWALLGLALCATSASATTMVREDVPSLARSSDAIVRGKVVRTESRWTSDRMRIITLVEVEVEESLKGAPSRRITLVQPGGQVGDIAQKVSGLASLEQGEPVVLFLRRYGKARYVMNGLGQGKFRVEQEGGKAWALPQDLGDATLVDRHTQKPVKSARRKVPLEELRAQVDEAVREQRQPGRP